MSRCCWATATARSSPRSRTRSGRVQIAIVAGDFTGDGQLDLAVAELRSDGTVSVLLGNGDGTFQPQVTYAVGIGPSTPSWRGTSPATATSTWPSPTSGTASDVSVLLGNGDGTFQPQVTYAVGARTPRRHRGGRLHRRRPARPGRRQPTGNERRVSVLLGNGDGTFQPAVTVRGRDGIQTSSWRATSTATAGSTWPSPTQGGDTCRCCWATATARSSPRSRTRWGRLQRPSWRATSTATAASTWPSPTTTRSDNDVSVLLGNGDGTFQPAGQTTRSGRTPDAIVAGDFNGDGQPRPGRRQRASRSATRLGAAGQRRRHVPAPGHLRGRGGPIRASWRATSTATAASTWPSRDSDGVADTAGQRRRHVPACETRTRSGSTRSPSWRGTSPATASSTWPSAATYNDVAYTLCGGMSPCSGQRRRHVPARDTYAVGLSPTAIVAGDFNGDGRLDLAVTGYNTKAGPAKCRCCWATATAPSSPRSPTRSGSDPSHRGGGLHWRRPPRPGRGGSRQ